MVAFSTIFLLVKIHQQPIKIFEISGYWSCRGEENACYHVKEHKKLGQKLVSKVTLHFVWGNLWKKQTVDRVFLVARKQGRPKKQTEEICVSGKTC